MKRSLNHALLVLRSEQRENRARLRDGSPQPLIRSVQLIIPAVEAVPIGNRSLRVLCRASGLRRVGHKSLVMLFRGFVRIGAFDLFRRVVPIAIGPSRGNWRIVAHAGVAPDLRKRLRRIAPKITRVQPQILILIEILRGKQIHRQSGWVRIAGTQCAGGEARHGSSSSRDRTDRSATLSRRWSRSPALALGRRPTLASRWAVLLCGTLPEHDDPGNRQDAGQEPTTHDVP